MHGECLMGRSWLSVAAALSALCHGDQQCFAVVMAAGLLLKPKHCTAPLFIVSVYKLIKSTESSSLFPAPCFSNMQDQIDLIPAVLQNIQPDSVSPPWLSFVP